MSATLFLTHIASTLILVGIIWVVQIAQYPFFVHVKEEDFVSFHRTYTSWITPIVAPPMLLELFTGIALLFFPPENIDYQLFQIGVILILGVWASTFFIQVPLHDKLARKFDSQTCAALVKTNWIRTVLWSLRGALVIYFAWENLK
jgi:hypothetical protein